MFKDASHYFLLQLMRDDSKKITEEDYEKLSESGKRLYKVGDIMVIYHKYENGDLCSKVCPLQNAIEEVSSLKYVEFRKDIPVFEV